MILFGIMSIFHDTAYQSLVPEIIPRPLLIRANARLEQSAAVAETSGPAISGGLVSLIGAPFTILINALSYLSSGILMASIQYQPAERTAANPFKGQIKERTSVGVPAPLSSHTGSDYTCVVLFAQHNDYRARHLRVD